jgi:hypothetical protein
MAVKDTINNERVAVRIITVDPPTRRVEGALRSGGMIQIRVWDTPSLFRWPEEGEVWLVQRKGLYWELDSRVENNEDGKGRIEDVPAGTAQVHGSQIKMGDGRDVVVTDQTNIPQGRTLTWDGAKWVPGVAASPTYTNATLPSYATFATGTIVHVSDGAPGQQARMATASGWINLG